MAKVEWKHHGCLEIECFIGFVDGWWNGLSAHRTGDECFQWVGRDAKGKQLTGCEDSMVAAKDMAMRECGLLAEVPHAR